MKKGKSVSNLKSDNSIIINGINRVEHVKTRHNMGKGTLFCLSRLIASGMCKIGKR